MSMIIFEKYKDTIPKNKEFRAIKDEDKKVLFKYWTETFTAKVVREALGINFNAYRTYVDVLLDGKTPPARSSRDSKKSKEEEPQTQPPKRIIVDADYIDVTAESKQEPQSLAVVNAQPQEEAPRKALVSIDTTDHPEILCEQITALLAFLRFQKEPLTIKLDVYK